MFKSQLEPPSENFHETQVFVENIFDTVKKAREAKAARSLAESKLATYDYSFDFSPSKRKKTRKNSKSKKNAKKPTTPSKKKPRKNAKTPPSSGKKKSTTTTPNKTPRKYTKRAKVKPQNDIDDEEAAFILSSISQRSFDSFYNRYNGNSIQIPLETTTTITTNVQQPTIVYKSPSTQNSAYHVLLDHNYWIAEPEIPPKVVIEQTPPQPAPIPPSKPLEVNNNKLPPLDVNCETPKCDNAVKKRWLRQATSENTSPILLAVTPPETSPNDLKAPLKKRRLDYWEQQQQQKDEINCVKTEQAMTEVVDEVLNLVKNKNESRGSIIVDGRSLMNGIKSESFVNNYTIENVKNPAELAKYTVEFMKSPVESTAKYSVEPINAQNAQNNSTSILAQSLTNSPSFFGLIPTAYNPATINFDTKLINFNNKESSMKKAECYQNSDVNHVNIEVNSTLITPAMKKAKESPKKKEKKPPKVAKKAKITKTKVAKVKKPPKVKQPKISKAKQKKILKKPLELVENSIMKTQDPIEEGKFFRNEIEVKIEQMMKSEEILPVKIDDQKEVVKIEGNNLKVVENNVNNEENIEIKEKIKEILESKTISDFQESKIKFPEILEVKREIPKILEVKKEITEILEVKSVLEVKNETSDVDLKPPDVKMENLEVKIPETPETSKIIPEIKEIKKEIPENIEEINKTHTNLKTDEKKEIQPILNGELKEKEEEKEVRSEIPPKEESEKITNDDEYSLDSIKSFDSLEFKTNEEEVKADPVVSQVASILEKVIPKTLQPDETIDDEEEAQHRECVEEFHKDTLEKLMNANKRFFNSAIIQNPFKSENYRSRYEKPFKSSLSFESHQPSPFQRSISEYSDPRKNDRWSNGIYERRESYGSFHYDKIHHRDNLTTTYSMYRAQKASQSDQRPWGWNQQPEQPVKVISPPIIVPTPTIVRPVEVPVTPVTPVEPFGGFLKEKLTTPTILPKTASSDPRLNPSLVTDFKKDEPATPKKKVGFLKI